MNSSNTDRLLAEIIKLSKAAINEKDFHKTCTIICEQTKNVVAVDRIVIVNQQTGKIIKVSGNLEASYNSFSLCIQQVHRRLKNRIETCRLDELEDKPDSLEPILNANQSTDILWLPLSIHGKSEYCLWLERWNKKQWNDNDIALISHITPFYANALIKTNKFHRRRPLKSIIFLLTLICILSTFFIPYQLSIPAPLEIIPYQPTYLSAPLSGRVIEIQVKPGQRVKKGDSLIKFDTSIIDQKIKELKKQVEVAMAEIARLEGESFTDTQALSKIPVQKLEIKKAESELTFYESIRLQTTIFSPSDGVVMINQADKIVGTYFQEGELMMMIADPQKTHLQIMIPIKDSGLLELDAKVTIRLDSNPLQSYQANISHIDYQSSLSDTQVPSVRAEAQWTKQPQDILPGQRGMGNIEGPEMSLGLQLFRKPLIGFMNWIGL